MSYRSDPRYNARVQVRVRSRARRDSRATHHPRTPPRRNCSVTLILFSCDGGHLVLPGRTSLLVSRENGGNLVVNPPRPVWERSELSPFELTQFAFLVAACGRAMI